MISLYLNGLLWMYVNEMAEGNLNVMFGSLDFSLSLNSVPNVTSNNQK